MHYDAAWLIAQAYGWNPDDEESFSTAYENDVWRELGNRYSVYDWPKLPHKSMHTEAPHAMRNYHWIPLAGGGWYNYKDLATPTNIGSMISALPAMYDIWQGTDDDGNPAWSKVEQKANKRAKSDLENSVADGYLTFRMVSGVSFKAWVENRDATPVIVKE